MPLSFYIYIKFYTESKSLFNIVSSSHFSIGVGRQEAMMQAHECRTVGLSAAEAGASLPPVVSRPPASIQ
jgi:hypothetical protein